MNQLDNLEKELNKALQVCPYVRFTYNKNTEDNTLTVYPEDKTSYDIAIALIASVNSDYSIIESTDNNCNSILFTK